MALTLVRSLPKPFHRFLVVLRHGHALAFGVHEVHDPEIGLGGGEALVRSLPIPASKPRLRSAVRPDLRQT